MKRSGIILVVLMAALVLSGGTTAGSGNGWGALQSGDVETDAVVLQATVDERGDASWTINYRIQLDDENTTAAFESLQADIRNNSSAYRDQFSTRMRSTVAAAENATGREMAVSNISVTTRTTLDGQYGVVSYGFQWKGFAATEGDQILVGDALEGLFLDANTKLTFRWPDGYELQQVDPAPDNKGEQSATWQGPIDFGTGQPRIIVAEPRVVPSWAPYVAVPLVLLLAGGLWFYRREQAAGAREPGGAPATNAEETTNAAGEGGKAGPSGGTASKGAAAGSTTENGTTAAGQARAEGKAKGEAVGTAGTETPEELLSPEERVLGLLENRGGRMKQKVVTEELDWSAARTSQVVGDLRDAGKIESFRLGRENVLKFPEDDEEGSSSL